MFVYGLRLVSKIGPWTQYWNYSFYYYTTRRRDQASNQHRSLRVGKFCYSFIGPTMVWRGGRRSLALDLNTFWIDEPLFHFLCFIVGSGKVQDLALVTNVVKPDRSQPKPSVGRSDCGSLIDLLSSSPISVSLPSTSVPEYILSSAVRCTFQNQI